MPLTPMPVIIGAPRSGTTLLRFMIDSHPLMAIPPETGFLAASALFDCDTRTAEGLNRLVTTFPPETPAWQDFGLDAAEFRDELQRLEPFNTGDGFRTFYRLWLRTSKGCFSSVSPCSRRRPNACSAGRAK